MKLTNSPSSITLVLMQPASNGDKPLTSWQSWKKKRKTSVLSIQSLILKHGFQLVLWTSRLHILLAWSHFLLVLVNDFVRRWLHAWALKVPTSQVSFKKYLPSKKIYLSLTTGWNFFHPCCTMNLTDQNLHGTNFLAHILDDCYCNWQHFRDWLLEWDTK